MTHVRSFCFLALLAAAGCMRTNTQDIQPAPRVIEIQPGSRTKLRPSEYPGDVIVKVKGPSVVYVFHAQKLRTVLAWMSEEEGQLTVPVGRIAENKDEEVYIGVTADRAVLEALQNYTNKESPISLLCHVCLLPNDNCCPRQHNQ